MNTKEAQTCVFVNFVLWMIHGRSARSEIDIFDK